MSDPTSENDKLKPAEKVAERTLPTDPGKLTTDAPIDNKEKSKSAFDRADELLWKHAARIASLPPQWWASLRSPDVSNRTIAAATVIIAIATVFTYLEVRSGSNQTDKIIAADERLAGAMEQTVAKSNAALDQTSKNFQSYVRPYIWLTDPIGEIFIDRTTKKFGWNIHYLNYGGSPAIHTCWQFKLLVGGDALKRVFHFTQRACSPNEGALVFGKGTYATAGLDSVPTRDEVKKWMATEGGVVAFGRFDYSDSSGGVYSTEFCMAHQSNGVIAYCYEDMK